MDYFRYITSEFWESELPVYLEGSGLCSPIGRVDGLPEGAVVFSSSGSSGASKWIVHTRKTLLASARMVNRALAVTEDDSFGLLLPLYHVGGFGILARTYAMWKHDLQEGGRKLFVQSATWNPLEAIGFLEEHRITITSLVPTQIHDLVSTGVKAPKGLRVIVVGGGQLSPKLGAQARALGWPVLQSYGMSEAGSQIATASLESLHSPYSCDGLEVLEGWRLETDSEGRLLISGAPLCHGIVSQQGEEMQYIPVPSPYPTQDRASLESGQLTFLGRFDRVVKIKGELVDLDQLEASLSEAIQSQVVILPEAREREGFSLRIVTTQQGHDELLISLLPKFVEVVGLTVLAQIPKSGLGKVDRRKIVSMV